jgi:hypothetical protein
LLFGLPEKTFCIPSTDGRGAENPSSFEFEIPIAPLDNKPDSRRKNAVVRSDLRVLAFTGL